MPTRITVQLRPAHIDRAGPPPDTGPAVRGFMLGRLSRVDSARAESLHSQGRRKPVAVTPVFEVNGQPRFEVGILDDDLAVAMLDALEIRCAFRVGRTIWELSGVEPLHLGYRQLLGKCRAMTSWDMAFVTPTTFRTSVGVKRVIPFPAVEQVFGGLLKRWETWSDVAIPATTTVAVTEHLEVASYGLRTESHLVKADRKAREVGFVGVVTYRAAHHYELPEEALVGVTALSAFAVFAGVGDHTFEGMGCTRVLSDLF